MPLAQDLNELIRKFGMAMATAAEKVLHPVHVPGDAEPDLAPIEANRTNLSKRPFKLFPSQRVKIAAMVKGMARYKRLWLVAEMGCGKSPMSVAAAWAFFRSRGRPDFKALVLCPGHIVRKWRREAEWALPGAYVKVARCFHDFLAWRDKAKGHAGPSVLVVSKETAKLGFDVDKPCGARRKILERTLDAGGKVCGSSVEMAACPDCGAILHEDTDNGRRAVSYDEYIANNEPCRCEGCGERLSTNARGFRSNPHLDRFIQRKMPNFFDLLIADEVHELAGAETIQGNTFGTLASACRYTLALTGTLIGGRAEDLHAPLWRMSAGLLRRRGFDLGPLRGGRVGAISRNARGFTMGYGVMERQICRDASDDVTGTVQRGACGRRREFKTIELTKPGISPDLFNHFLLGRAVFMSLSELGPALPTIERILEPCPMSPPLRTAYDTLDKTLEEALKRKAACGGKRKGPPALATIRIQALDAYADKPFGWSPITCPRYDDNGIRCGSEVVAVPEDLGDGHLDGKDRRMVELCKKEVKQGRKCCVYPVFTGRHDVRPKIMKALAEAGLRTVLMPDTVLPVAREDWIARHVEEMDVLIVHPKRVMTGLDLVQFPTLIWFQLGYSTHVLRQASARARRPIQTQPCKVIFLFYERTIQEKALALMGEKEAASQALEGTFDTRALKALMNGGEDSDIMAALARSLERGAPKVNAKAAWSKLTEKPAFMPMHAPVRPVLRPMLARRQLSQQFLFDM
ncbi:MAG: DEAD/DEAH box helicase [Planctomycetes bacterium]|nr:DEAD/DEAH box helicase [Planctomycetota bacterium]